MKLMAKARTYQKAWASGIGRRAGRRVINQSVEDQYLDDIQSTITDYLEPAVVQFVASIGEPRYIGVPNVGYFDYPAHDARTLQVLKAVRVVSTLNGMVSLLRGGFVTEVGTLGRAVDDFLAEIMFIEQGTRMGTFSQQQQKFIEHYFAQPNPDYASNPPGGSGVRRRDIQEAQADVIGVTPETAASMRTLLHGISSCYNAYAHGSYSTTMDLYEGGAGVFHVHDMLGTQRIPATRRMFAQFVGTALSIFATLAYTMGMRSLSKRLVEKACEFSASATAQ